MSVLNTQVRDQRAKPQALRNQGIVPMALVEKGLETRLIQAPVRDVLSALAHAHGAATLELKIEGEKAHRTAIVKAVDRNAINHTLTHVTLMQVSLADRIRADVSIVPVGVPVAVAENLGVLLHPTDHISVRGKVSDIPDHIDVDVSQLGVHTSLTAHDLDLPENLELMSSPESVLFSVAPVVRAEEPEPSAEQPSAEAPGTDV